MDTLTKSCSPTIVITANGEVQTHEEARVYVKEFYIFLTMKVLENMPAVLSLGKLCDENGYSYEWINGQKPHLIKNGIRIPCNTENFVPIVVPGLSSSSSSSLPSSTSMAPSRKEIDHPTSSSSSSTSDSATRLARTDLCGIDSYPVTVKWTCWKARTGRPVDQANQKKPNPNKNENDVLGGCTNSEKISWMIEFLNTETHTLVLSHEVSLEPTPARSADLSKHSVYTHFPQDPNCEICQRTKITRPPCRRRIGGAVLRAGNFGDLIAADHKVLSEGCESRNNHGYAVVVQDLATQWIQSYPCKKQTSQETQELAKVLGAE